jgi:hypothetical protein
MRYLTQYPLPPTKASITHTNIFLVPSSCTAHATTNHLTIIIYAHHNGSDSSTRAPVSYPLTVPFLLSSADRNTLHTHSSTPGLE